MFNMTLGNITIKFSNKYFYKDSIKIAKKNIFIENIE